MKISPSLASNNVRMLGLSLLSVVALLSSFYLQYVEGYQPCVYCYVLRYLTMGILATSTLALLARSLQNRLSAVLAGLGLVGTGVSFYLILDETFPSAAICTACSITPIIFGVSLYHYSIAFMALVLGVSVSIFRSLE